MTAPRAAQDDLQDTTVDEPNRIELLETPSRVHWVTEHIAFAPGVVLAMLACGSNPLNDEHTSFGSAAAITCARCKRAWDKEQR